MKNKRLLILALSQSIGCSDSKFAQGAKKPKPGDVISPETQTVEDGGTLDQRAGLPTSGPIPAVRPEPLENAFIGGATAKFRLGNGMLDASSNCYTEVIASQLNGEAYLFEFELVNGPADIRIISNALCGVDVFGSSIDLLDESGASSFPSPQSLLGGGTIPLSRYESSILKLNKGKYTIRVEAGHSGILDIDDFVVGGIEIKSNSKVIVPGEAKAYQHPVKPTELSAEKITSTTAVLKWKYPQNTDILGFKICFKVAGSFDEEDCSGPDIDLNKREKTLTGLRPNTDYLVKVSAFNKAFLGYYGQLVDSTNTVQSFRTLSQ